MRRHCDRPAALKEVFQSTHPVRGATRDDMDFRSLGEHFNPRTPCGVRPHRSGILKGDLNISIHAPRAGCDPVPHKIRVFPHISIHAPRAGCDFPLYAAAGSSFYFNPRTPCGVRLSSAAGQGTDRDFNPRTPCGVRRFSSTVPVAPGHFNPRTPCGVRQDQHPAGTAGGRISIHAPRAGCDGRE